MGRNCQVLVRSKVNCVEGLEGNRERSSRYIVSFSQLHTYIGQVINNDTVKSEAKLVMPYTNYNDSTVEKL